LPSTLYDNYPSKSPAGCNNSTDCKKYPGMYKALAAIKYYGTTCVSWDQQPGTPWYSYCPAGSKWCGYDHNWCQQPWCYVDSSCATAVPSTVFSGSDTGFYSYNTCANAPDCYSKIAWNSTPSPPKACPFDSSDNGWHTDTQCPKGWLTSSGTTGGTTGGTGSTTGVTTGGTTGSTTIVVAKRITGKVKMGVMLPAGTTSAAFVKDKDVIKGFKNGVADTVGCDSSWVDLTLSVDAGRRLAATSVKLIVDYTITVPLGQSAAKVSSVQAALGSGSDKTAWSNTINTALAKETSATYTVAVTGVEAPAPL